MCSLPADEKSTIGMRAATMMLEMVDPIDWIINTLTFMGFGMVHK